MTDREFNDWIERARAVPIGDEINRRGGINLKRVGAEYIGPCPQCGGEDRFAASIKKNVFNCRQCGAKGDVIAFVQHVDAVDFTTACATLAAPPPEANGGKASGRDTDKSKKIVVANDGNSAPIEKPQIHDWGDSGPAVHSNEMRRHYYPSPGTATKIKIKMNIKKSGGSKFTQWFRAFSDEGVPVGWQSKQPDNYKPIPYVTATLDPFDVELRHDAILWPEGEKDVETLSKLNLPAFTFGGVGDGLPDGIEPYLKDRHIVVLADNDEPGRDHAAKKAAVAHAAGAASIKVIHFPELPEKGDVSDFIADCGTVEQLKARISDAPLWSQSGSNTASESGTKPNSKTAHPTTLNEHEQLDAEIKKLAALPISAYAVKRAAGAKRLGMPVGWLDAAINEERNKANKEQNDFLPHWKAEPWAEPIDGAALLESLRKHFVRYVVLPKHVDVALASWTLHTWVFDCFDITPYLAITSPTRRCGKTLLMTMLYWLCCRAKKNDSMSKAAIYRSVESERPTLLLDETSWVVDQKDDRQGILCGGFERNGFVENCEGESANYTVRRYSTYCPKAFGLIGKLTATLMDRAIEIAMQRKTKGESVERLGRRDNDHYARLRQQCLRWANDNRQALVAIKPKAPDALNDRALDIWEPLLVIAEQVAGDWPKLVAKAAIALSGGDCASEERSVELLADIKSIFDTRGLDEITTKALLAALRADEERPWATYNKGKQISDRQVAKLLGEFRIRSADVYPLGEKHAKGYKRVRFLEAL